MAKAKKGGRVKKSREDRREKRSSFLPPVIVARVVEITADGEALAVPAQWEDENKRPPSIILDNEKAPSVNDTVLVKLTPLSPHSYSGKVLKILPKAPSRTLLGVYRATKRGGLLEPVSRKQKQDYFIAEGDEGEAQSGDLVVAEAMARGRHKQLGLPQAKVKEILGDAENPKCFSLIAIFHQDIPVDFPADAVAEAEAAEDPVPLPGREDLRDIALVTIDGSDARDFDDAVFAEPYGEGGWHLLVAIADVAHYVQTGSALDKEALNRGNSVYFPDRVVPMLPEALSNGLCSLNPNVDRYCLAVHLWIDAKGELERHQFVRGIMRSHARLTYELAQQRFNAQQGEVLAEINHLYGAYRTLLKHRDDRGALELDLPEFKIAVGEDGHVAEVNRRERLDSHKLIEEFMVTANIAAARTLEKSRLPGVYRVHEPPSADKVEELRLFLKAMGHSLNPAPVAKDFNRLLDKIRGTPQEALLSGAILRSQMQAVYLPQNLGHFGLALTHYSHFTSPIRRYSDLITHRAIIAQLEGKAGKMSGEDHGELAAMADHISQTERRAMLAEREATDRYITAFMADSGEAHFEGYITSVGNYGVFVTLTQTGASGLIRISDLGRDFFMLEEHLHCLIGRDTGQRFQLGQKVVVQLKQADVQTGSLSFALVEAGEPPHLELSSAASSRKRGDNRRGKGNNSDQRRSSRKEIGHEKKYDKKKFDKKRRNKKR